MKRILLAATLVGLGTVSYAQSLTELKELTGAIKIAPLKEETKTIQTRAGGGSSVAALGDTIFYESFGNGYAGDGSNGAWTNNGTPTAAIWEYRGLATTPDLTVGSQGAFNGGGGANPPASATPGNGFMIFDSDYLDNGGSQTGGGTGPAPTPHTGELVSPVMDLSAFNQVLISVDVKYRRFVSDLYILFSTDGGTTYGDTVLIYGDAAGTPVNSPHVDVRYSEYVSTFIGGVAQARIKFWFDGVESHGNVNGSGYYYAMVDDFAVLEAPDNDIIVESSRFIQRIPDDTGTLYYSNIPANHAALDTLELGAAIISQGTATQVNTIATTVVTEPSGATSTVASTAVNVTPGQQTELFANTPYNMDQGVGTYTFDVTVASDSTDDFPGNNAASWSTEVTDSIYARDFDQQSGAGLRWLNGYEIFSSFELFETDTVTSLSFQWSGGSQIGSVVSLHVYSAIDLNTPIVSRPFVQLSASNTGQWETFGVTETELTAGTYFVSFETLSNTDTVFFAYDDGFEADPGDVVVDVGNDGTIDGFITDIPYIRMNLGFNCSVTATFTEDTAPTCGNSDGAATVSASGGNAPYTYEWPGGATGATQNNLSSGDYDVTITDAIGCQFVLTVTLIDSDAPGVTGTVTDLSCFQDNTGAVDITVTSANNPFSYNWSNGSTTEDINGVAAGTYTVTVTDNSGCTNAQSYDVTEPAELTASISEDDPTFGDAVASGNGGTSPYSYAWSTGDNTAAITGAEGSVTVTVTDANGCTAETSGNITPVSTNDLSFASSLNIFPNPNNGNFNVAFTDMSGIYTISVVSTIGQVIDTKVVAASGNHVETFNMNNLNNGIYFITVKSEAGSEATFRVVVK